MNQGERSPLHIAAMDDDASAIGTLLADGESPDVQDEQGLSHPSTSLPSNSRFRPHQLY